MVSTLPVSLVESKARERAQAILDEGSARELLGPFDRFESPHLEAQNIVPQSDDGMVIMKGTIQGRHTLIISIEGSFQGEGSVKFRVLNLQEHWKRRLRTAKMVT